MDRGESDYFFGAYTINLLAALVLVAGIAVVVVMHPGWPTSLVCGVGIAAIAILSRQCRRERW